MMTNENHNNNNNNVIIINDHSVWNRSFHVDNFIETILTRMTYCGLWPINYMDIGILPNTLRNSYFHWTMNIIFFVFVNFVALHLAILYSITFYYDLQNGTLDEISASFTQSVIYFFTYFVICYFEFGYKKCSTLIKFMNTHFRYRSAKGLSFVTAEPTYSITKRISMVWFYLCAIGVLQWTFYPLYIMKKVHPLNVWYPFNELESPLYEIVYILQVFGQIVVGLAFTNSGALFLCICICVCGQYDILFCSLKNIRYTAMIENGNCLNELKKLQREMNADEDETNQYFYSYEFPEYIKDMMVIKTNVKTIDYSIIKSSSQSSLSGSASPPFAYLMEYNNELKIALSDCIEHHLKLIQFCRLFDDFFSPFVLVKSIQLTLQICNLAFTATKTVGSLVKYINLAEYLMLTLIELFMFCFGGEMLKYQSLKVGTALLRSPWHLCGGPFRRSCMILLLNTTKPQCITGGKFFILDYEKLKQIMKASFSYFTLLQKLGT